MMSTSDTIVSIGEILWDSMPAGLFPGGASFNVACHLKQLGRNVTFISRIGDDQLGTEALRRVTLNGLETNMIQKDAYRPTGFVEVELNSEGIPRYNIIKPAAWDYIELTSAVQQAFRNASVIVFGTLAQRMENSQRTIQWIEFADAKKVLDLNLREPHYDRDVVEKSLEIADVLKINEEECMVLQQWFDFDHNFKKSMSVLSRRFNLESVCITRGKNGALLWHEGEWAEEPGHEIETADTVGAGDAFLAALIDGIIKQSSVNECLKIANRLGAYVATQNGAVPEYSPETVFKNAAP